MKVQKEQVSRKVVKGGKKNNIGMNRNIGNNSEKICRKKSCRLITTIT